MRDSVATEYGLMTGFLADLGAREHAADVDHAPPAHVRATAQHRAALHGDVRLQHHRGLDAGPVTHGDPRQPPAAHDARLHRPVDLLELHPVVDAGQDIGPQLHGGDALVGIAGEGYDVGEVELPLSVVGDERRQCLPEKGHVGGIDARVDLADSALGVVAKVLVLADELHLAGPAHDAPVARRVVDHAGRKGQPQRPFGTQRGQDRPHVVSSHQRHVPVQDQDAHRRGAHRRQPNARCVSRPSLMLLDNRPHPSSGKGARQVLLHHLPTVAHHHHHLFAAGVERRLNAEVHDGKPRDGVHHFGERALHTRPLSGGENDGGRRVHGYGFSVLLALARGRGGSRKHQRPVRTTI